MIIWLASYPKSGNTFMRSLLSSYYFSKDGNFEFDLLREIQQFPLTEIFQKIGVDIKDKYSVSKNYIKAQEEINKSKNVIFLKTHSSFCKLYNKYNFSDLKNSLGVIYIVRDPRNLVKSISHHFDFTLDKACEFLLSPEIIGNGKSWEEKKDGMYNLLGKWNDHYRSWTVNKDHLLLIKYEDLLKDANTQMDRIIDFLKRYIKFNTNTNKNKNILETTSFKNLQDLERKGKFIENAFSKDMKKINFFHLGPKNKWEDDLNENIKKKIENNFRKEMQELGYLD